MKPFLPGIFLWTFYFTFPLVAVVAQQDPLISQYMFSGIFLNPAAAGTKESLEIAAIHRTQWHTLNSNPSLEFININAPANHNRIGLGGQLLNVSYNELKFVHLNFSGSYKVRFRKTILSTGLELGTRQYSYSYENLVVKDLSDQVLNNSHSRFLPDIGTGLYLYHRNYHLGFSARHLNQAKIHFGESVLSGSELKPHYYFTGSYKLALSERTSLSAFSLLKYTPSAPFQVDFTLISTFYNVLWTGATYRSSKEAGILVGLIPNKIIHSLGGEWKIGYAFDYGFNKLSINNQAGSHEIVVLCNLNPRPNAEKIKRKTKITSPMIFGSVGN